MRLIAQLNYSILSAGKTRSLLYGRWREVVGGEGQVLLLSGEAGIGKSRIIQILCDRIADEHHNIIRYQCSPHHTNTALYPAINYLRQAAGFARDDSSNAKLNKLNVMAVEAGVENQETVSLIADLLSIRGRSTQLQARLVGAQSRHVSNAQSASTSALYRTRFSDRRGKSASARSAAGHSCQDRGRPLYIEELTKNVLESGVLTEEAHAYTLKATLKHLSIPESLQASLMERLDRFAPIRGIVQAGAAVGREFSYTLLQAIVKASEAS